MGLALETSREVVVVVNSVNNGIDGGCAAVISDDTAGDGEVGAALWRGTSIGSGGDSSLGAHVSVYGMTTASLM